MGMDEVWAEQNELEDMVSYLNKKVSELEAINISLSAKCQMMQQEISLLKMQSSVQNGSQITQWEYKEASSTSTTEKNMNELGKEGWELTGITACSGGQSGQLIFKRPKQKTPVRNNDYPGYGR